MSVQNTYNNIYWTIVELPWDEPTVKSKEFVDWQNNKVNRTPWVKIDSLPYGMLWDIFMLF